MIFFELSGSFGLTFYWFGTYITKDSFTFISQLLFGVIIFPRLPPAHKSPYDAGKHDDADNGHGSDPSRWVDVFIFLGW